MPYKRQLKFGLKWQELAQRPYSLTDFRLGLYVSKPKLVAKQ